MNGQIRLPPGITVIILALALSGAFAGCNVIAWVGQSFPQKVKAVHRLEERPTLILVDDPTHQFDDLSVTTHIASEAGDALLKHSAIEDLVPPHKVDALMVSLGDDWVRTGIDQIGKAVGAEQVVHMHLEKVRLYSEPGLLQPSAVLRVKVIDVVNRRRLFPTDDSARGNHDFSLEPQGYRIKVEMGPRGVGDPSRMVNRAATRRLALRIARDAARLFYDHFPRQPGKPFE